MAEKDEKITSPSRSQPPIMAPGVPDSNPASRSRAKLTGLKDLKNALSAQQRAKVQANSIPLTEEALQEKWRTFINLQIQAQKRSVASNLQMARVTVLQPNEVGITSKNIVQHRFLEEEKMEIAEFLKKEFNNPTLLITLSVDEDTTIPVADTPILSSKEQYQRMVEKYPLLKELKDRLNLELDY